VVLKEIMMIFFVGYLSKCWILFAKF